MADEGSAFTEPASPGVFIASPALEVAVQLDSLHPPSTFLALSFVHGSCLFFRLLASRRFASWSPICVIPVPCLARGHGRGCCTAGSRPRCWAWAVRLVFCLRALALCFSLVHRGALRPSGHHCCRCALRSRCCSNFCDRCIWCHLCRCRCRCTQLVHCND